MLKKLKKIIFVSFSSVLLAAVAFAVFVFFDQKSSSRIGQAEPVAVISNEQNGGRVLGEEGSNPVATKFFASQNFRTPQITFGGDAITVPSGEQSAAPEISDMRSQLMMTKGDEKVEFLLSWKTDKPCSSLIEYSREGQTEPKTVSEDGYGFAHSAEIAPLNYSTSYSYTVAARDKWGNVVKSDKLSFYTGAPKVSILDLLGGAFKDMFGWAGR